jgi:hypothetical protein
MPSLYPERMLRQGDRLLRKLNAGTWNPGTLDVFPNAFRDNYDDLSLFVERIKSPREVLKFFAGFPRFRRAIFGNIDPRTPEELWHEGIGIGVITFDAIRALGLEFKVYPDRSQIDEKGHVEVIGGKRLMLDLSTSAVALSFAEVFPTSGI